jgi:CubicO group peptidase (beta-lactamase class C family)
VTAAGRRFVLAVALALPTLAAPAPAATQRRPASPLAGLDAYVAKAVRDWGIPGLAIAVVKDDSIVFAKGYGVRTLGTTDPVDANTLFAVGSTTKAFTAASLGLLVDEGKVRLDDPVVRYLPSFQLADPWVTRELTVRDLLTHRSGLGGVDLLWYGPTWDFAEIMKRLRYVKPASSLRSRYAYQNVMYATAGQVVATASGMPWSEFVRQHWFAPLGMTRTNTSTSALAGVPNVATPHARIDDTVRAIAWRPLDAIAPAGAINSSVADMARWIRFLLDSARMPVPAGASSPRVLSARSFAELFTPQFVIPAGAFYPTTSLTHPNFITYGLGWFLHDYRGARVAMHTGSIDGMSAIVGLIPARRLGVVVLANLDHAELRHALMYRVFDLYLPPDATPPRDWSTEMRGLYAGLQAQAKQQAEAEDRRRVTGTHPSLAPEQYAGAYLDSLYGTVNVRMEAGGLVLTLNPAYVGDLGHWNYDTFRITWRDHQLGTTQAVFTLGGDGAVRAVALDGIGEFIHQAVEGAGVRH